MIIGIDHGFFQMKTANNMFVSGVSESRIELPNMKDMLYYNGRAYQIGGKRKPHQLDKTLNDDYYLLTLAAIAKEIKSRNLPGECSVQLAAGLPLAHFARENRKFTDYLMRDGKPVDFVLDSESYRVRIESVSMNVQGHAAVVYGYTQKILEKGEPRQAIVDIGGGTTDVFIMENDRPLMNSMDSHKMGVITMYSKIKKDANTVTGAALEDIHIEHYLSGKPLKRMPQEVKNLITGGCKQFAAEILGKLSESNVDINFTPLVFIGGGSCLIRPELEKMLNPDNVTFIDEIRANAKGYEHLARAVQKRKAN